MPLSYCARNDEYPFFTEVPEGNIVINDCELHSVNWITSFYRTLRLLHKLRPDIVLACGYERPETLAASIYSKTQRLPTGVRPGAQPLPDTLVGEEGRGRCSHDMNTPLIRCAGVAPSTHCIGGGRARSNCLTQAAPSWDP